MGPRSDIYYPGASNSCISIKPGFLCIKSGPLGGLGASASLNNLGMGATSKVGRFLNLVWEVLVGYGIVD